MCQSVHFHSFNANTTFKNLLNVLKDYRYHAYEYLTMKLDTSLQEIFELIQCVARSGLQLEIKKKYTLNRNC